MLRSWSKGVTGHKFSCVEYLGTYPLARFIRLASPRNALRVCTTDVAASAAVLGVRVKARGLARVRRVGVAQAKVLV